MRLPSIENMANPDRLTDKAVRALRWATRVAWERHHGLVSPEHLLLALFQMEPNVAGVTLERLGLNLLNEQERINTLLAAIRPESHDGEPPGSPALDDLFPAGKAAAEALGHDWFGTEHLV